MKRPNRGLKKYIRVDRDCEREKTLSFSFLYLRNENNNK